MVDFMEIKVDSFIENDDGSAIVNLEMDSEAKEFLIKQGFNHILRVGIDKFELEFQDADNT